MTAPRNGGWDPPQGPYRPPPPAYGPPTPPGYGPPTLPAYGAPPVYGQFVPGPPPPPRSAGNRAVLAATAFVVLALVIVGVVAVRNHQGGSAGPSSGIALPTTSPATSLTTTSAAPTTAQTTAAPTTSGGFDPSDADQLCTDPQAPTDLIHLTVALSFTTSYAAASAYEKPIIDSCATPAVIAELKPYFGKDLGLPGGDLTGGNGEGDTARFSVQIVNTSKYISFTLVRKQDGRGYQVVAITAS